MELQISSVTAVTQASTASSRPSSCSVANRECSGNAATLSCRHFVTASPAPNRSPRNCSGNTHRANPELMRFFSPVPIRRSASRLRINPGKSRSDPLAPILPAEFRFVAALPNPWHPACPSYWGSPSSDWLPVRAPSVAPNRISSSHPISRTNVRWSPPPPEGRRVGCSDTLPVNQVTSGVIENNAVFKFVDHLISLRSEIAVFSI
jgi:hypothetical protein